MASPILSRLLRIVLLPVAFAGSITHVNAAPITAVPPAQNRAVATVRAQPALQLSAGAPTARVITLAAPRAAELARAAPLAAGVRLKRTTIGIGRDVPAVEGVIDLGKLAWQPAADGDRVVHLRVESTGAASLRVALRMNHGDPDVTVRIAAATAGGVVQGPYPANLIAQVTATLGEWWSPVIAGSAAIIEVSAPVGASVAGLTLTVARMSHLSRAPGELGTNVVKNSGPGTADSCERNWMCVPPSEAPPSALSTAASAVARIIFTQRSGDSYLCSGTLINDSLSSLTPYFATAAHCIDSDYTAQTLDLFWFYDSPAGECSYTPTVLRYVEQASGGALLANNIAEDWALVRLNAPPPGRATFSAWNATPFTPNTPIIDLHHPKGDTKKYSAGTMIRGPDNNYTDVEITRDEDDAPMINAPLIPVHWSTGVTEGGSSGSGLLTYLGSGGYYELRGALTGGGSACSDPGEPDFYSRMDRMLPLTRDYLAPGSMPANQVVVVEYYNESLDHYFMTASALEMNVLDTGTISGWVRTGARFIAYNQPAAGASPVCRFYQSVAAYGNSHFYSASPSECAVLVDNPRYPGWVYESANVFYIVQPNTTTGACPVATHPLWRFFHAAVTNHRYTADISLRDRMRQDPAWTPEGYGPDAVIMCAPDGS